MDGSKEERDHGGGALRLVVRRDRPLRLPRIPHHRRCSDAYHIACCTACTVIYPRLHEIDPQRKRQFP